MDFGSTPASSDQYGEISNGLFCSWMKCSPSPSTKAAPGSYCFTPPPLADRLSPWREFPRRKSPSGKGVGWLLVVRCWLLAGLPRSSVFVAANEMGARVPPPPPRGSPPLSVERYYLRVFRLRTERRVSGFKSLVVVVTSGGGSGGCGAHQQETGTRNGSPDLKPQEKG